MGTRIALRGKEGRKEGNGLLDGGKTGGVVTGGGRRGWARERRDADVDDDLGADLTASPPLPSQPHFLSSLCAEVAIALPLLRSFVQCNVSHLLSCTEEMRASRFDLPSLCRQILRGARLRYF